jgi:cysteinyl-tRNA synthetase
MVKTAFIPQTVLLIAFLASISRQDSLAQESSVQALLQNAKTWMYQLQGLERPDAVEALAKSNYALLVLEPTKTVKGNEGFDTSGMVRKLHTLPSGKRRLLLAYLCIGEAEDYRLYWGRNWRKPTNKKKGKPDFIIALDPDGWSGNYPVVFWDPAWKKIWLGESGWVRQMALDGFDGVYLDWVEAYDHPKVRKAAESQGLDPAKEMIRFIEQIGEEGKKVKLDFLVIPQNAINLLDKDPSRYLKAIDGLGVEDTWFHGTADAKWESPAGGDQPNEDTQAWLAQYQKFIQAGKPVFSIDYCLKPENAAKVYEAAKKVGLRALVTRMELSAITPLPPPGDN